MTNRVAVVTGASRGLGLALTNYLLADGFAVVASHRTLSPKLAALAEEYAKLTLVEVEFERPDEAARLLAKAVGESPLDLLINNAAILLKDESLTSLDIANIRKVFDVNTFAPILVSKALLLALEKAPNPKILNISSESGITGRVRNYNGLYTYKASKAALNMFSRVMRLELKERGVDVLAMHPGWIRTDMGGADATLSPDDAAKAILEAIKTHSDNGGGFVNWRGEDIEW